MLKATVTAVTLHHRQHACYDILQLVSKNSYIPDFLSKLTLEHPDIRMLKQAILDGDTSAAIWNAANCNLYLIYLMQQQHIPFWHGITAYVYLIAKMQYTTTPSLRAEDEDVKLNYTVELVALVNKAGKISELGYQYLLGVRDDLAKLNFALDLPKLQQYVLSLPRIEQYLLKTEFNHHTDSLNSDRLIRVIITNVPFLQKISAGCYEDPTTDYLVPSASLINYFLNEFNADAMQMRPILGDLGLKTLYAWHKDGFHPVSLYATQIRSNPKQADGYRCGPFAMWLHDVGHTFWASMLSKQEREFIFCEYIPALRCLQHVSAQHHDEKTLKFLQAAEEKAYDFDLTAISHYAHVRTRLTHYLAHTFGKNHSFESCLYRGVTEFASIGQDDGDNLYFLLNKFAYDPTLKPSYQAVYRLLLSCISTGKFYRKQNVVRAIAIVGKNAVKNLDALMVDDSAFSLFGVDRQEWRQLLNSTQTSEALWQAILSNTDRSEELLHMLSRGLLFFHPYLAMTVSKRAEFIAVLTGRLNPKPINAVMSKRAEEIGQLGRSSTSTSHFFRVVCKETGEELTGTPANRVIYRSS